VWCCSQLSSGNWEVSMLPAVHGMHCGGCEGNRGHAWLYMMPCSCTCCLLHMHAQRAWVHHLHTCGTAIVGMCDHV
jgi:hypothetical protein